MGSSLFRNRVCSAGLKAQVPSGFFLGSRAAATALAPSTWMLFPAAVRRRRGDSDSRREGGVPCPLTRSGGKAGGHHFMQETGG